MGTNLLLGADRYWAAASRSGTCLKLLAYGPPLSSAELHPYESGVPNPPFFIACYNYCVLQPNPRCITSAVERSQCHRRRAAPHRDTVLTTVFLEIQQYQCVCE